MAEGAPKLPSGAKALGFCKIFNGTANAVPFQVIYETGSSVLTRGDCAKKEEIEDYGGFTIGVDSISGPKGCGTL